MKTSSWFFPTSLNELQIDAFTSVSIDIRQYKKNQALCRDSFSLLSSLSFKYRKSTLYFMCAIENALCLCRQPCCCWSKRHSRILLTCVPEFILLRRAAPDSPIAYQIFAFPHPTSNVDLKPNVYYLHASTTSYGTAHQPNIISVPPGWHSITT